jgi:formylglycine-generating enzyme required for sulfatase activity
MIAFCGFSLGLLINVLSAQVVIVPGKPGAPTTSSKGKPKAKPTAKPRPKATDPAPNNSATAAAPKPTPTPASAPSTTSTPARTAPPSPAAPQPSNQSLDGATKAISIGATPSAKSGEGASSVERSMPSNKLFEYIFNVVTTDARGKVVGTRQERARNFIENLGEKTMIEMVEIPGGMFLMGIQAGEIKQITQEHGRNVKKEMKDRLQERLLWETPQHAVKLPAYFLSKFEITQAQWLAVSKMPKVKRDLSADPSYFKGFNRPVEMVSWFDAVEFCDRLSRATGRKYRLPTEAEWEYACRAGSTAAFHFGETIMSEWANYEGKSPYAEAPKGPYREQTIPVGSLGVANAFGLYDMHGNVWEWCLDSWHNSYLSAPGDGKAWEGDNLVKVIRGGAWNSYAGECRASSRNRITAPFKLNEIGFRVVAEM